MKRKSLWLATGLLVLVVAFGAYYLAQRPPTPQTASPPARPEMLPPAPPSFPEEPAASGGQPRLRWIGPGEGHWEDPENWEDEGDKSQRVPGPEDDLFIPEKIGARTARVLITDGAPKHIRSLVNRGVIRGMVSAQNPTGSVVLEVAKELINYRRIESADTRAGEPSAVIIKAGRLRNQYAIEAGRNESPGQNGGRVEITADIFENKDEVSGGDAWGGQGGAVTIQARLLHNMGAIRAGRGGQHAQSPPVSGGDVVLTATEEINQYDGRIEGGRSFSGRGGSVRLQAPKIHHLGGLIRASDGVAEGGIVVVTATKLLLLSGTKTSITGYQIALSAPEVNIHGLESKSLQARAKRDSIKITACEKLNLSGSKNKGIFELPQEGALSISVPHEQAIALDRGISLEFLATTVPQVISLSGPCKQAI